MCPDMLHPLACITLADTVKNDPSAWLFSAYTNLTEVCWADFASVDAKNSIPLENTSATATSSVEFFKTLSQQDPRLQITGLVGAAGRDWNGTPNSTSPIKEGTNAFYIQQFMGGMFEASVSSTFENGTRLALIDPYSTDAGYGPHLPVSTRGIVSEVAGPYPACNFVQFMSSQIFRPDSETQLSIGQLINSFPNMTTVGGGTRSTAYISGMLPVHQGWSGLSGNNLLTLPTPDAYGNTNVGTPPYQNVAAMIGGGYGFIVIDNSASAATASVNLHMQLAYNVTVNLAATNVDYLGTSESINPAAVDPDLVCFATKHDSIAQHMPVAYGMADTRDGAILDRNSKTIARVKKDLGLDVGHLVHYMHKPELLTSRTLKSARTGWGFLSGILNVAKKIGAPLLGVAKDIGTKALHAAAQSAIQNGMAALGKAGGSMTML